MAEGRGSALAGRRLALLALVAALGAPPGEAAAQTGAELYAACAPAGASLAACNAYIQGLVDDSKLVDGDLGDRFVGEFGRFCLPPEATTQRIHDLVIDELRRAPNLRAYSAAISVRFALVRAYPCPRRRP